MSGLLYQLHSQLKNKQRSMNRLEFEIKPASKKMKEEKNRFFKLFAQFLSEAKKLDEDEILNVNMTIPQMETFYSVKEEPKTKVFDLDNEKWAIIKT